MKKYKSYVFYDITLILIDFNTAAVSYKMQCTAKTY